MIEVEVEDGVAIVSLCQPPVNAIGSVWIAQFNDILDALSARGDWRVLHIRSRETVFCAGADLKEVETFLTAGNGVGRMIDFIASVQRLFARVETLPQATIAEIGGSAMGGGLELALACDFRIAAEEASLGLPEVRLGLLPGAGGTQRLTNLCGKGVASRLIVGGERVGGAEAAALGIVQWARPRTELKRAAADLAARLVTLSAAAIAECKACIAAAGQPDVDGFEMERAATERLFENPDTQHRIRNFFEKASKSRAA